MFPELNEGVGGQGIYFKYRSGKYNRVGRISGKVLQLIVQSLLKM